MRRRNLLDCVLHDPRWDRQVESRDDYYAGLLLSHRHETSTRVFGGATAYPKAKGVRCDDEQAERS